MTDLDKLAKTLDALGHPLRLKIIVLLSGGELYLKLNFNLKFNEKNVGGGI